jgi:hypothetical protein
MVHYIHIGIAVYFYVFSTLWNIFKTVTETIATTNYRLLLTNLKDEEMKKGKMHPFKYLE